MSCITDKTLISRLEASHRPNARVIERQIHSATKSIPKRDDCKTRNDTSTAKQGPNIKPPQKLGTSTKTGSN